MKKETFQTNPMAIIGMGSIFSQSPNLKAFLHLLTRGRDAITDPPSTHAHLNDFFDPDPNRPDHIYCKRGGFLPPIAFDPTEFGIPPHALEATDTSQLLGLLTAKSALVDAGYGEGGKAFDRERVSIIIGVTGTQELVIPLGARLGHPIWRRALVESGVGQDQTQAVIDRISEAYVDWQENSFPGLLGNVVAGRIANRLDLGGTNCVVDAACASSMGAVHMAAMELAAGRSDMVITGGVDTINDAFMHMCFAKSHVLSASGEIRPFSRDADGTVLGEGIGLVVLKRLKDAERDGDRIYAVIRGIGAASDGKSSSIYAPRPEGQVRALRRAYQEAGIDPMTVDLVEAHGTGTRVGDQVEFRALREVFGATNPERRTCALGSVKSNIGHTKATAGTAGLIKAALALYFKVLPPTLKADPPDPRLDLEHSPFYLNTRLRPWMNLEAHPRRAGVSAFGFGGSNFHVVMEEHDSVNPLPAWDGSIEIVCFSADRPRQLIARIDQMAKILQTSAGLNRLAGLAAGSRREFKREDNCRMVVVLDQLDDADRIHRRLDAARACATAGVGPSGEHADYVTFGQGNPEGSLAFLFPGQGSQYPDMGRDLVCTFPESLAVLQKALAHCGIEDLDEFIYPRTGRDDPAYSERLRRTEIAQPAIGAVSMAMLKALGYFNVLPQAACGHSYGELTALCAAGWISQDDLWTLSVARGRAMAQAGAGADEPGIMTAVEAPLDELSELVKHVEARPLVLANRNSPRQGVLSGSHAAVSEAEALCRRKDWKLMRLPVAAAFHSPLVEQARHAFENAIRKTGLSIGSIPVMNNSSGAPYPAEREDACKILGAQLANPVDFLSNIESLYAAGARTFIEVGPRNILTRLVDEILTDRAHCALAVDRSCGRRNGIVDLACVLARLTADGHPVSIDRWESEPTPERRTRMAVTLSGANYRIPRSPKGTASLPEAEKSDSQVVVPGHAVTPAPLRNAPATMDTRQAVNQKEPTNKMKPPVLATHQQSVQNALVALQHGMAALQSLQSKTAEAHLKFLETQAEASRTLRQLIQSAQHWASPVIDSPGVSLEPATSPITTRPETPPGPYPESIQSPSSPERRVATPAREGVLPPQAAMLKNPLAETLIDIVSRLTGYPAEMLGLDMDIESDLGIDSIKRVEILSALEEQLPDLPKVTPEMMGTLKTLGQICDYLTASAAVPSTISPTSATGLIDATASDKRPGVRSTLIDIVSRLTGYPAEMLGLDMDIESDLGIDSIKRVEILSALEEQLPDLPKVTPEMMGTLKTLGQICDYLTAGAAVPSTISPTSATGPIDATASDKRPGVRMTLIDIVSRLTGYPAEMLGLDMDIESDLGIDSIKRVEILSTLEEQLPDLPKVTPEMMGTLKTLGQICDYLTAAPSIETPTAKEAAPEIVSSPAPRYIIQVVPAPPSSGRLLSLPEHHYVAVVSDNADMLPELIGQLERRGIAARKLTHIDDLTRNPHLAGLILLAPLSPNRAFLWARAAAPLLNAASGSVSAFFATVSFLDGAFGFQSDRLEDPRQGALAGLAKTAALEWPHIHCRAIDVDPQWKDIKAQIGALADEILHHGPHVPLEIGLGSAQRVTLTLTAAPAPANEAIQLHENDVVVVTGGARGVTAAACTALAAATRCRLALIGRSPAPDREPKWLERLSNEGAMKKAILDHQLGPGATPKALTHAYEAVMANRQISRTLAEVEKSGNIARYFSADVCDKDAIQVVFQRIRKELGPIRALIHGAGVLEDRLIEDKRPEQFERVFNTKVAGLENTLNAAADDDLRYLLLFSSVSARMGNSGQADYAMANEVLNKMAHAIAAERLDCKVVSLNWGPWDGGMVTPALRRSFQKQGVELISIQQGAAALLTEMRQGMDGPVEVVIGGPLHSHRALISPQPEPSTVHAERSALAQTARREIDVERYPVLKSHYLDGHPVVPLALITEWLAHGALHANPGMALHGIDNLRLLRGITLENGRKTIRLMAGKPLRKGQLLEVEVEIRDGVKEGREIVHSQARALLADHLPQAPRFEENGHFKGRTVSHSMEEIYEQLLFHGHHLRGIRKIIAISERGLSAQVDAAPAPERWMVEPMRSRWIADPLILDCAFQMAIIWCQEQKGMPSLPSYAAAYRQYRDRFPEGGVISVLEIEKATDRKMVGNYYFLDENKRVVAELKGYEAIMDSALTKAFHG